MDVVLMSIHHDEPNAAQVAAVAEISQGGEIRKLPRIRTAVYEIFVDRFAGPGGSSLNGAATKSKPWHHHCGGTLDGIAARLDHVQALGADAVYLTPIFTAPSNHKYDATTYEHIDEGFGGDAAFEKLSTECRNRDIGLILDG